MGIDLNQGIEEDDFAYFWSRMLENVW